VASLEVSVKDLVSARGRARWSVLVFGFVFALAADVAAAEAEESADACVGFRNETLDKQLVIHASNSCERRLSCTLDYTVLCEDTQGKQTSRVAKRTPFQLEKQGSRDLSLSAEACHQGWRIDELRWNCG
jgi:hypothetical protein